MMKRNKVLLPLLVALTISTEVWADVWQDPVSKVNYEYTPGENEASVKAGTPTEAGSPEASGDITIRSTFSINGEKHTITSIAKFAFNGCKIINVSIPNTVKEIGDGAWTDCWSLQGIWIEDLATWCSIKFESGYSNGFWVAKHLYVDGKEVIDLIIPDGVTSIEARAFTFLNSITSVTIPKTVTSIGAAAFLGCNGLKKIISDVEEPFAINSMTFYKSNIEVSEITTPDATLYVPAGTKALYEATDGWNKFKNIVEMVNLEPMAGETIVNTENLDGQDLTDNVVNDVYYNVGDGGYDAEDGSVVISQATNMSSITDAEPGTDAMKENFTGMILRVAKGKGTVKVRAKTSGNVQLVVQVGKGIPMLATMNEQGDAMIGYDVKEDSYVYIYAIMGSSLSRATRASSDSELRIYDIAVSQFDTTPRLPGDTNNDGKLDIVDVTTILDTILGRE